MSHVDVQRLKGLVGKLTLEEKVAQLAGMLVTDLVAPAPDGSYGFDLSRLPLARPNGVGHVSMAWFLGGGELEGLRTGLSDLQDAIRASSPFGIGALIHFEAVSGLVYDSGPQFPTPWGQATTWNMGLIQRASAVSGALMESLGIHLAFSPLLDVARDIRWGRVHETYGEDVEMVSRSAIAFISGLQRTGRVRATGKHFLGYAASEGGLNQAVTHLGHRALIDEHAEPFRRAIAEADLRLVMNSYNEVDGLPAASNTWLLSDLLRGELGFAGLAVSDYDSIQMLKTVYHTAETAGQAAAQALTAGLDADLPGGSYYLALTEEVRAGRLSEEIVDRATLRTLILKDELGLVPNDSRSADSPPAFEPSVLKDAGRIRRQMANEGVVLLSNDGILPLQGPDSRKVVVVGPAADDVRIHFGAYSAASNMEMQLGVGALRAGQIPGIDPASFNFTDIFQARMPTMVPAFEQRAREIHPAAQTIAQAVTSLSPEATFRALGSIEPGGEPLTLEAVMEATAGAEIVIAAVGERTGWVGIHTAGEGQSTMAPRLPGNQEELLGLLQQAGKPVITVVVSGRPLLLADAVRGSAAVVLAPLLGEDAGAAIADAIFGRINPSGKLVSTFPRHVGQIPMYHGHKFGSGYDHPTGTRHGYNDAVEQSPLFAFGHGLSYTEFEVSIDSAPTQVSSDGVLEVKATVRNRGDAAGETVVQLYGRDEVASVVRPVRQLLQFERVSLEPGASKTVTLTAPVERLAFTGLDDRRIVEPGAVRLLVGLASDDIRDQTTIHVV
jgi:beta-xylosidase